MATGHLQSGRYQNRIFFDPEWIKKLAGKFSLLYFQSLSTQEREGEQAWKTAHRLVVTNETSVFQDMLLGLNAHINWESAQLAENIACEGTLVQRSLRSILNLFSKDTFGVITLEREETVPAKKKPEQAISPF